MLNREIAFKYFQHTYNKIYFFFLVETFQPLFLYIYKYTHYSYETLYRGAPSETFLHVSCKERTSLSFDGTPGIHVSRMQSCVRECLSY